MNRLESDFRAMLICEGNLRRQLEEKDAELARLRAENEALKERENHRYEQMLEWRGIDASGEHKCPSCGGAGVKTYSNTSTWREGAGGQMMTPGVCNKCWGSGVSSRPWPSWRELEALRAKLAAVEADAARWRYWRKRHGWTGYFDDGATNDENEAAVDKACDTARQQEDAKS